MAGIRDGAVGESNTSAQIEPKTASVLRRRRMEIRHSKLMARSTDSKAMPEINDSLASCAGVAPAEIKTVDDVPAVAKFGMASVCGRRRDMEDAVSLQPAFWNAEAGCDFYGVYDGHGCSHVAEMCRELMHQIVGAELSRAGESDEAWKQAMERSFWKMDDEVRESVGQKKRFNSCRCEVRLPQCDAVGSTAVVSVVTPEKIVISNCGDSRAVLCRNGVVVPLTSDHKPDRPDELKRIEKAGGRVIYWDGPRVLGVLAMSRAIGDNYLRPYVIPKPEVAVLERSAEDEFMILASDGLWDVVSNEMACEVVRVCLRSKVCGGSEGDWGGACEGSDRRCMDACILLTKLALDGGSSDNISVVVVDLKRKREG